jgi:hypothetical protein
MNDDRLAKKDDLVCFESAITDSFRQFERNVRVLKWMMAALLALTLATLLLPLRQ